MSVSTFILNRVAIDNINREITIDRTFGLTFRQFQKLTEHLTPIRDLSDLRGITFEGRDVIEIYNLNYVPQYTDFDYLFIVTRE